MRIILGSASKRRQQILKELGYDFDVLVSNIDEKIIRHDDFKKLPQLLAEAKAEDLLSQIKEPAILITSDVVVVCNGELFEKPQTEEEARHMLQSYSAHPAEVISAVVVTNTASSKRLFGVEIARVYFHKIPETLVEDLIKVGRIFEYGGGFSISEPAIMKYVVHIEGTPDTVLGFPKLLVKKLIEEVA